MAVINSYYLYQKYEKRGNQPWIPCYPNTWSIDGDGTMPPVLKQQDDPSCYHPIYRWVQTQDTICIDTTTIEYRTTSGDPYCNGYDKYVDTTTEQSFDGGVTWEFVSSSSTLVEADSPDCGWVSPPKFTLTLSDASTVSAECDSTSAITSEEVATQYSGSVVSAVIGDCVTTISGIAFYGCSGLTSVTIPDSVTTIGQAAFNSCSRLTNIVIPNSVNTISGGVFGYCTSLTSVNIPSGITRINNSTFYSCSSLTDITIPDNVQLIDTSAFDGCSSLTSVTIGSGVTTIGQAAFYGCSGLTSVTIPDNVQLIDTSAFYGCSGLTSVTIGNNVVSIGDTSFNYCVSLTGITIPDSVTSIGNSAFIRCSGLTSVIIGSGVTSIGRAAFGYCTGLTSITVNATTPPALRSNAFNNTNNCPIYVPCASVDTYKAASGWSNYASRIEGIPPCGQPTPTQYRWTQSGTTCIGYDKYQNNIKEQSTDGGTTWTVVIPEEYSASTLIESQSTDCGYVPPTPTSGDYFTIRALEDGDIIVKHNGTSINYSLDSGSTWQDVEWGSSAYTIAVSSGDTILWKGSEPSGNSSKCKFSSTCNFEVYGNIMSLIRRDDFEGKVTFTSSTYTFSSLFENCSKLINAENLYLPATTLVEACYSSMFYGCTNLLKAPSILPATTLARYCCSSMFQDCTSLTTAPQLPATTLAETCYSDMFRNCTSLTTAPQLPATTLARYCYSNMFYDCTNLNTITCLATDISAQYCTSNWVRNVAASGIFTKAASMTSWSTGVVGIPSGWTVQDYSN